MKFEKGDRVIWRPKPGSVWYYPPKDWDNVPPAGTVGTVTRDHEEGSYVTVRWEHKGCVDDNFPPEYLEPYVESQTEINWLYPEEGHEWKEGDEIIAEYILPVNRFRATARMRHRIARCQEYSYDAWEFENGNNLPASDVRIIAYIPYVPPNPPEEPQDCPFCGSEMKLQASDLLTEKMYWYQCVSTIGCGFRATNCKTKEEAIKTLNSVKVVKE